MINPEALRSAIQERIQLAEAATPGPWEVGPSFGARDNRAYVREQGSLIDTIGTCVIAAQVSNMPQFRANAAFIAAHDPSFMLRVYRQWLDVLDRHQPRQRMAVEGFEEMTELANLLDPGPWCSHDMLAGIVTHAARWPCPEVLSVAAALGLSAGPEGPETP